MRYVHPAQGSTKEAAYHNASFFRKSALQIIEVYSYQDIQTVQIQHDNLHTLHRRSTLENARDFFFSSPHRIIISRRPAKHKLLKLALRRRTKIKLTQAGTGTSGNYHDILPLPQNI